MKRTLLAGAALLVVAASPAHAAFYSWEGVLYITAVNNAATCGGIGLHVGDTARGIFRPKGLGQNGNFDALAWHFGRSAGQLSPTAGPNTGKLSAATAANVRYIYGSGGFGEFANIPVTGAAVSPLSPTTATSNITVTVTIPNAYSSGPTGLSGCDITFKGTLAKRLI